MAEPYELTASDVAAEIAGGRLSPIDLVDSLLARIEALDGEVHAWVRVDRDGARSEARACADELVRGHIRGPLHGVLLAFKDIYFTKGLATEAGSPLYRGFVPDQDAATVARLRAAGAIVLGKTETTQFAMGDPAPTRNPWNLAHTPGGSSSGSAAAVAARMVPAALGTQTAGSVLRPASFCGITGFKPSAGRFSLEGIFPLAWTLDHPGTLTRGVADARLLFGVLDEGARRAAPDAGTHGRRPASTPRIGLLRGKFIDRTEPRTLTKLEEAVDRLARQGAAVVELRLPDEFELSVEIHHVIMAAEAAAYHASNHLKDPNAYRPNLRALIEAGSLVPAIVYLQAQRLRAELARSADGLMREVDCLAMPSALGAAPAGLASTGNPIFNAPWSLFGLPALSIPSGLSDDGLPLGLQLIGRFGEDELLLDSGEWCEGVLGPLPLPSAASAFSPLPGGRGLG